MCVGDVGHREVLGGRHFAVRVAPVMRLQVAGKSRPRLLLAYYSLRVACVETLPPM